jgi:hypothetical protein
LKTFENHENYNCKASLEDGSQYYLYANWLSNNELHHWRDWHCEAGVTRILIDKNLNVWSGECKNDKLGDIDQGWSLFEHHSVCSKEHCTGCTEDLLTTKWCP